VDKQLEKGISTYQSQKSKLTGMELGGDGAERHLLRLQLADIISEEDEIFLDDDMILDPGVC
jgi:hypothetical protein